MRDRALEFDLFVCWCIFMFILVMIHLQLHSVMLRRVDARVTLLSLRPCKECEERHAEKEAPERVEDSEDD